LNAHPKRVIDFLSLFLICQPKYELPFVINMIRQNEMDNAAFWLDNAAFFVDNLRNFRELSITPHFSRFYSISE